MLVVPVTARTPRGLQQLRADAGFDDWALCANGALAVHLGTGEQGFAVELETAAVRAAADAVRAVRPDAVFASVRAGGWTIVAEPGYVQMAVFGDHQRDPSTLEPGSRETVLGGSALKLIARGPGWDLESVSNELRRRAGGSFAVTLSGAPFVEIIAPGVSKASGLAALCDRLDIDRSDVVAFGDALNDAEMLAWAGTGVAVANAVPSTREAADAMTASNTDDGVARWIEGMLAS